MTTRNTPPFNKANTVHQGYVAMDVQVLVSEGPYRDAIDKLDRDLCITACKLCPDNWILNQKGSVCKPCSANDFDEGGDLHVSRVWVPVELAISVEMEVAK